ncbi:MAG: hypothetical protein ACLT5Y_16905, partial [Thomasclavelia ramosa]
EAHKMTKEIKEQYPEVDYKFQLSLCLSFLSQNGGKEMLLKESYKAIAVNSGLDMDVFVKESCEKVEITKIVTKNQIIFERNKNNFNDAKLGIKDNKFFIRLENTAFKNFLKIAGIKMSLKSACLVIKADDLKEAFIQLPKLRQKERFEKEEIKQVELNNKLNENSIIVIEREFAKLFIRNEFENSSIVKNIVKKIERNLDCRVMNFDPFKVSEIKTDFCFSETYEITLKELKKIEKIADEIENKRKSETEKIADEIERNERKKYENALKKAKETGKPQVIKVTSEFVERGDSDIDNIVTYVYPDGTKRTERGPAY